MRLIKPLKLGFLSRCYEYQQRFHMGMAVMAYVPLGEEPGLFSDIAMWQFVAEELGKDAALDMGIPKAGAEYLIHAKAFAPNAAPVPSCYVRAQVAGREKVLFVHGDRRWDGATFTDPRPFVEMPIDWAHAYGGADYAKNPLGKGHRPIKAGEEKIHYLPNIEDPEQPIVSPDQRVEPAGFGPIDLTWPQRFALCGTHDQNWLEKYFPGFAADIDWRFFNLAPSDQHFEQGLRGDERYWFENMHPQEAVVEGRLPGLTMRCLVARKGAENESLEEVATRLTTVWFFPHTKSAVLIYHGDLAIEEEDGTDVALAMIGAEWQGRPKELEHYRTVLTQRLDEDKGHLYMMRDRDLMPEGMPTQGAEFAEKELYETEQLRKQHMRAGFLRKQEQARQQFLDVGLDPDTMPEAEPVEEPPEDLADLPEYMERMEARAAREQAEQDKVAAEAEQQARERYAEQGMDYDEVQARAKFAAAAPPKFRASAQRQQLEQMLQLAREQGAPTAEIEQMLNDEKLYASWLEAERQQAQMYRVNAHRLGPAARLDEANAVRLREQVRAAHQKGMSLAGQDFTGGDFRGMDLRGVDLRGAFLSTANLTRANLEGADLSEATLAHATLDRARLTGAKLIDANLGGARMRCADVNGGVDASRVILAEADLSFADFSDALLGEADLSDAHFKYTDFSRVQDEFNFIECDLREVLFHGADLRGTNFIKSDVSGCDFTGANLEEVVFLSTKADGACFAGANLRNFRCVEACSFTGATFVRACLAQANLRAMNLAGADLTEADLSAADLSESDLGGASLFLAQARGARFVKANLTATQMGSMNLMDALLARASMSGANLNNSNLFRADLARVRTDPSTTFANALLNKVRIHPKLVR